MLHKLKRGGQIKAPHERKVTLRTSLTVWEIDKLANRNFVSDYARNKWWRKYCEKKQFRGD